MVAAVGSLYVLGSQTRSHLESFPLEKTRLSKDSKPAGYVVAGERLSLQTKAESSSMKLDEG